MISSEKNLKPVKNSVETKVANKENNNGKRFNDKAFEDLDAQLTQYLLSNKVKKSKAKKSFKKSEVNNPKEKYIKLDLGQDLKKGSKELNQRNNSDYKKSAIKKHTRKSDTGQEKESTVKTECGKLTIDESSHPRRNDPDALSNLKINKVKGIGPSKGTDDSKRSNNCEKNGKTSYVENVPQKPDKQRAHRKRQNNLASPLNMQTGQNESIYSRVVRNNDSVMRAYNKLSLRAALVQRNINSFSKNSSAITTAGVNEEFRDQIHVNQVQSKAHVLPKKKTTSTARSSSSSDDSTSESSSDSESTSTESTSDESSSDLESDSDNDASYSEGHEEKPNLTSDIGVNNQTGGILDSVKKSAKKSKGDCGQSNVVSIFYTNPDKKADESCNNKVSKHNQSCELKDNATVSVLEDLSDISDAPLESDSENVSDSRGKPYLQYASEPKQNFGIDTASTTKKIDTAKGNASCQNICGDKNYTDFMVYSKINNEEQIVPTHNRPEGSCSPDVEQNSSFFDEIFAGVLYVPECLSPIKDEFLPNEPDNVHFRASGASNGLNISCEHSHKVGVDTEIDVNQACWNIPINASRAESTPKKSDADKSSVCSSTSSTLKLKFKRCKDSWSVSYSGDTFSEKGRSIRTASEAGRSIRSVCQGDNANVPIELDATVSLHSLNKTKTVWDFYEFGTKNRRVITDKLPIDTNSNIKNAMINKVYMKRAYTQNGCVILRT